MTQESHRRQASWDLPHLGEGTRQQKPSPPGPASRYRLQGHCSSKPRRSPSPTAAHSTTSPARGSKDAIPTYLYLGSQTCFFFPFSRKFYSRREDGIICTWIRSSVPRTCSEHLVGAPPKGLNYLCSRGSQIPKITGNRVGISWVGLEISLGNREGVARSTGCRERLDHWSLRPTSPGSSKTS